ncbi:unknown protein [Simkania negevensis Z]|uniref:Uncharacterized protein n=1 Tax=Simkania negevensis (strain ATCC VR-1471 / DSM 27360 / Z) TaxID=331113 RepID=F8L9N5_SIMNZ|nr:unknown protein [Simkania negevensis Z]
MALIPLYSNNFKNWFWATRKLSEFVDFKWPNIRNMRSLKIGKLRCFGAAENPIFEVV